MENPEKYLLTCGGRIFCVRCTAMSKHTRKQCRKPALNSSRTRKCGFHGGGKGSGKQTAEGKARIGEAHLIHGRETNERKLERSESSLRLAQLEDVCYAVGLITTAPRSPGRKPLGYRPIRTLEEAKAWVVEDVLHRDNGGRKGE